VGVYEENNRLTYLQILALTYKLLVATVPVSIGNSILHRKLKNGLSGSLIDLSVIALFPMLHTDILQYVKVQYHTVCSISSHTLILLLAQGFFDQLNKYQWLKEDLLLRRSELM
jgi:hypothetical protein